MSSCENEEEVFVLITDYPNYKISQYGNIINIRTNHILKGSLRKGYVRVTLYNNKRKKTFSLHRLVGKYFVDNPKNKPQINHLDCDKQNNYYKNLEWCDNSENQKHAWENGLQYRTEKHKEQLSRLIKKNKQTKRTLSDEQVRYIRNEYEKGDKPYSYFAKKFNVSGKTIELVVKNKRYKDVK